MLVKPYKKYLTKFYSVSPLLKLGITLLSGSKLPPLLQFMEKGGGESVKQEIDYGPFQ